MGQEASAPYGFHPPFYSLPLVVSFSNHQGREKSVPVVPGLAHSSPCLPGQTGGPQLCCGIVGSRVCTIDLTGHTG
jgi:hypothetical protein